MGKGWCNLFACGIVVVRHTRAAFQLGRPQTSDPPRAASLLLLTVTLEQSQAQRRDWLVTDRRQGGKNTQVAAVECCGRPRAVRAPPTLFPGSSVGRSADRGSERLVSR